MPNVSRWKRRAPRPIGVWAAVKARSEISPREMDVKSFGSGARGFASEFGNGCDNYEGYSQNANDGGADGKIDFGGDKQTDDAADRCDHPADGEFRPDPIHKISSAD